VVQKTKDIARTEDTILKNKGITLIEQNMGIILPAKSLHICAV